MQQGVCTRVVEGQLSVYLLTIVVAYHCTQEQNCIVEKVSKDGELLPACAS
jgi:hypothetical protein